MKKLMKVMLSFVMLFQLSTVTIHAEEDIVQEESVPIETETTEQTDEDREEMPSVKDSQESEVSGETDETEEEKVEEVQPQEKKKAPAKAPSEPVEEAEVEGPAGSEETEEEAVASIGNETYFTLQEAIDASKNGDTIKVLKDITSNGSFTITKNITLTGKTIYRSSSDGDKNIIVVKDGGHLTFTDITLDGAEVSASKPFVLVEKGSELTMNKNSIIQNSLVGPWNSTSMYANHGGGVRVEGKMVMNSNASVTKNSAYYGGGVCVYLEGTLIMNDNSSIHHNNGGRGAGIRTYVESSNGDHANYYKGLHKGTTVIMNDNSNLHDNYARVEGGGIDAQCGIFTMNNNSKIYKNRVGTDDPIGYGSGGGVHNESTTKFTMNDNASITNNSARIGGGVTNAGGYAEPRQDTNDTIEIDDPRAGYMIMNDNAKISDNIAYQGGGINQALSGSGEGYFGAVLTMNGNSTIKNNSAQGLGGGIFSGLRITMNDNSSIKNNAGKNGGGIFLYGLFARLYKKDLMVQSQITLPK